MSLHRAASSVHVVPSCGAASACTLGSLCLEDGQLWGLPAEGGDNPDSHGDPLQPHLPSHLAQRLCNPRMCQQPPDQAPCKQKPSLACLSGAHHGPPCMRSALALSTAAAGLPLPLPPPSSQLPVPWKAGHLAALHATTVLPGALWVDEVSFLSML